MSAPHEVSARRGHGTSTHRNGAGPFAPSPGRLRRASWGAWILAAWVCGWIVPRLEAAPADYGADIRPLLRDRCYACHGALKQKGGLRLDTVERMRRGGDGGPAIVPGDAAASALVRRVTATDVGERMPPEHEGERFGEAQIALLRSWIDAGASGPADDPGEPDPREHWAFRPRSRPEVPRVTRAGWVRNPIDAFVAQGHEARGLAPRPEASRDTLVRRLYVDLVGMPPTREELERLDADTGADWYERLVDRLLEDPRHGERWARHWMDIWRYSDAWGLGDQLRNSQRHMWRWRDWLVDSLNADLPYDAMVRLMIAGDEIRPEDPDAARATGYLARNYFLFNRNHWLDETVEHVGKGLLGLTLNCSKCHDHKYDPIPQADYYRLRAFFEPYHVRVDMVPGEPDLNRDGVPRVFDGPEVPTYRFVRGQETQPDTTRVIAPGVPEVFAFRALDVRPVPLPAEAWQPERRAWVFESHRAAARRRVETARQAEVVARDRYGEALGRKAETTAEEATGSKPRASGPDLPELEAVRSVAEQDLALARAEAESLERRIAATRAGWGGTDSDAPPEETALRVRAAVAAQREVAVARARHALAAARLRRLRATDDAARGAAAAEVETARGNFERAVATAMEPWKDEAKGEFVAVVGAAWTATRFLDSTKDDPRVAFGPTSTGRRRALAEWITDPRHPLTARVGANHLWSRHMGAPLVATVFDFGRKGAPPALPGLLDWLASEWVEHGWSSKHLHRLIATSATYRMESSTIGAEREIAVDPDNRYWWRRPTVRLEAQVVRDAILAHAGVLDRTRGGPSVPPEAQADSKRRSFYFYHSNNDRNPFLATFDDATVKECYRRETSVVPQQALALSNSRWVHDNAGPIAARLGAGEGGGGTGAGDTDFARRAFRVLLGGDPKPAELEAVLRAMASWPKGGDGDPGGPSNDPRAGLVWVLLNHNDFLTLR